MQVMSPAVRNAGAALPLVAPSWQPMARLSRSRAARYAARPSRLRRNSRCSPVSFLARASSRVA